LWQYATLYFNLFFVTELLSRALIIIIIIIIILMMIFIGLLSSAARSHMREFSRGHLGESRSAPDGCQLAGQAENLTFEPTCRLL